MSDNLQDRGGQDRNRIDVSQDWELRYWSEKFGCSHDELKAAVQAAGTYAEDVEKYLSGSRQ